MYTLNQIPSEAQIRKYLRRIVFGKNVFCPRCASKRVMARQGRYHCAKCRHRFSLLSSTWLSSMKLPLPRFWLLLWCWTTQIPIRQTESLTRLSEKAIRHWFGQFRTHLPEETHILERIVQLDEAYFKEHALLMAKQVGTRKLAYSVIPQSSVQRHHATNFLFQKVKPGSKLWTDGAMIYKDISQWWPVQHSRDIHKKFQFEHTSEIEGTFGNYRTFVRRMYHHHWSENLPEYVREFCFRFSSPELFENPRYYLSKSLSRVPGG
jgi:transposase-like protein